VLANQGCLGQIPASERRVLTLRAGVGHARPRSRALVQRMTGLRRARVAALESSGLRRLRSLAHAGCAGGGAASGAQPNQVGAAPGADPRTGAPQPQPQPRIAVRGERAASASRTPRATNTSHSGGLPLLHTPDSPLDFAPIVVAFGLAVLLFAFVREARRSS
jgi:hypothetical protein